MGKYEVQVTATALHVRSGASVSYKALTIVYKNAKFTSSKQSNGWYYIDSKKGWSSGKYLKVTKNLTTTTAPPKSVPVPKTNEKTTSAQSSGTGSGIDTKVLQMLYDSVKKRSSEVDASMRLFGAPHQFTSKTDFRPTGGEFALGRKYLEAIVAESPIVYFVPGRPNFLPDVSKSEREATAEFFSNLKPDADNKSALDKILKNKDTRYFDFISDYSSYMRYVNTLCRVSAIYMGLGEEEVPIHNGAGSILLKRKYKWFDWSNYRYKNTYNINKSAEKKSAWDMKEIKENLVEGLFGSWEYTQFYVDPSTSFQESSSNNSAESKIANLIDAGSQLLKEGSFFMNAGAMGSADTYVKEGAAAANEAFTKFGTGGLIGRLGDVSTNMMSGSNIIFPEIWGSSAYNKSYNVTINLVSPYGDKESIYLNIIVPLMHLMALALPRQTGANSYASPFLVKVSSKGWFNCEMGIIDNISIEKVGGSWSVNGMPTEMKVTIGIKDLYSSLMMTPNSEPGLFFENKGLMNWLAVTCGVDVAQPAFMEKWLAILYTVMNSKLDIPGNFYNDMMENLKNSLKSWYTI